MTLEQIARLYVIFKTLEPEIKEWIASDDTAVIIQAIAARFVLSDEQERALPILVLRLITQDLPPESFKAELAKETGVDEGLAKSITDALAKEVIAPIGAALRYGGVDTNLLGFNAPSISSTPIPPPAPQAIAETPLPPQIAPAEIVEPPLTNQEPFILHEEPQKTEEAMPNANRSFAYTPPIGEIVDGKIPPRVVIERVVHYSQLRTPLNVARTDKNAPPANQNLPQSKWFV